MNKFVVLIVAVVIVAAGVFGYVYLTPIPITLNGAGATFPYPLLDVMVKQYEKDKDGQYPSTAIESIRVVKKVKEGVTGERKRKKA